MSGQPADLLEHLLPRLAADHRLELADHQRIRMRAERRAEQVVGVGDVGDPVAHRLVDRVLERPAAGVHPAHRRAEQLACARRSAPGAACPRRPCRRGTRGRAARRRWPWPRRAGRRRSRRRRASCPCACASSACPSALLILCAPVCVRSSRLRNMRTRRVALRGLGSTSRARLVERRRPADVVLQQAIELVAERRVRAGGEVARRQLLDRRDQRLGHEAAAVGAEVAAGVGIAPAEHVGRVVASFRPVVHRSFKCAPRVRQEPRHLVESFTPGAASTPDDTSTPNGRTVAIASRDVLRRQPAGQHHAPVARQRRRARPVHALARAAAPHRSARRAGTSSPPATRRTCRRRRPRVTDAQHRPARSASAYAGGSSPCSCTVVMPVRRRHVAGCRRPAR